MDAHGETRPRKRNNRKNNKERLNIEPEPEIFREKIIEEEDIGDDNWSNYHVEEDTTASLTYKILFFILLILLGGLATVVLIDINNADPADVPNGVEVEASESHPVEDGVPSSWLDWLTTEPHEDHGLVEEHSDEAREFIDHDHDDEEHGDHGGEHDDDDDQEDLGQDDAADAQDDEDEAPEQPVAVEEPVTSTTQEGVATESPSQDAQEEEEEDEEEDDDETDSQIPPPIDTQDTPAQEPQDVDDEDEVPVNDPNDIRSDIPIQGDDEDDDEDDLAPPGLQDEPEDSIAQDPIGLESNNINEEQNIQEFDDEFDEIDQDRLDDDNDNNLDTQNHPELVRGFDNIFDEDPIEDL